MCDGAVSHGSSGRVRASPFSEGTANRGAFVASIFLARLNGTERELLVQKLHAIQGGSCFICEQSIDLVLHGGTVDIDHIEPLKLGGHDGEKNFALTHSSCNRSKQASDLRVARVLARFARIRSAAADENRGTNLSDIFVEYGGAKHELSFELVNDQVRYSLGEAGDPSLRVVDVHRDTLSGVGSVFITLPIAYLHHDDRINPRNLGGSLSGLVGEFHKGRPQLHVALAWLPSLSGPARVKVFDGQHKAAAQVLLGVDAIPVRVFLDPDPDLLLETNTRAGTTLRQVAFDKSVQRRLGRSLFLDRVERYRHELGRPAEDEGFSEADLVKHFKGESREVKRYAIDAVRAAITHHQDNRLVPFVEFGGKSTEKPLSYSTI